MEAAYLSTPEEALKYFQVTEQNGLTGAQVQDALKKYGRNGTVYIWDRSPRWMNVDEFYE